MLAVNPRKLGCMAIWRPTDSTPLTPLRTPFGLLADSVEADLDARGFTRYTTKALMDANTTLVVRAHATVYADGTPGNNGDYVWNGTAWKPWESDWVSAAPLVTAASGSFVSVTAALRWKYSAGAVVYLLSVTVGSAGTASGNVTVAMPFTAAFTAAAGGMNQATGASIWGVMFSGESVLRINGYNGNGATGTGNILQVSGTVLV